MLAQFSNLPTDTIKGVRAPQLAVGGNRQFQVPTHPTHLYFSKEIKMKQRLWLIG